MGHAPRIARGYRYDSWLCFKRFDHAPKTTTCKNCFFRHIKSPFVFHHTLIYKRVILFCLPSKRINKESILLYLPACFIKIEYCSIFFFTNLFIDLIFLSIYLKVYTILLGLKPKHHLLFSHFLHLLKEILILPPPGIFINFSYFHSLLWITFFFLSTVFSTKENKWFFFFLVDSSFILYFSTDFELTTAKIFNFRGTRYA